MIISVKTGAATELIEITDKIVEAISESGVSDGICMLYVPHTTAAVAVNESADPAVKDDIIMILNKIIPRESKYRHLEGNSPAHIKATLIGASELLEVKGGRPVLGTWQGIFFCEFDGPRNREIHLKIL